MKKFIILLIIVLVLLPSFFFIIKKEGSENNIKDSQWALYNHGQTVNDVSGLENIDINITEAWEITKGSSEVIVAVIDSGVDTSCAGLQNNIYKSGEYNYDFYNNDSSVFDEYFYDYHGTYIANTITGYDDLNDIYGVSYNTSILPLKFLRGTNGNIEDAISAIKYACDKGAQIVNCSWNFSEYSEELYSVISENPDVLFVCAAGNSNANLDIDFIYPTCYDLDNILSVLAINNCGEVYKSSGRGMNVDIAAPGENVIVQLPENDTTYVNGTSVSTAIVSGVASLMLSVNDTLSPKEIKNIIVETARKEDSLQNMCAAEGIINAYECVKAAKLK